MLRNSKTSQKKKNKKIGRSPHRSFETAEQHSRVQRLCSATICKSEMSSEGSGHLSEIGK